MKEKLVACRSHIAAIGHVPHATEEGFHANICRSTNCYYIIDTIAQLIDWTVPLAIENRFAEDNRLIAVVD